LCTATVTPIHEHASLEPTPLALVKRTAQGSCEVEYMMRAYPSLALAFVVQRCCASRHEVTCHLNLVRGRFKLRPNLSGEDDDRTIRLSCASCRSLRLCTSPDTGLIPQDHGGTLPRTHPHQGLNRLKTIWIALLSEGIAMCSYGVLLGIARPTAHKVSLPKPS
jgi:hypothetical protein